MSFHKKIYFVLTVDTEEEWDWSGDFPKPPFSVKNTENIPKFQRFCNRLGIKPTYFIDYAIVSDKKSVERFKLFLEKGECEIGAHLHPWCTPPVEEEINPKNSHIINLPLELVRKKIRNLTQKITDEFEICPRTFRSGRWGMNGEILKFLAEEGYHSDDGFSYENAPNLPYYPDYSNFTTPGIQRDIFEIPVTSGFNLQKFTQCHKIHKLLSSSPFCYLHIIGILWRFGIFKKVILSPELVNSADMISCINACIKRGQRIIHTFFHSSSLLPGCSPYVKNKSDELLFYKNIEDVVNYLKTNTDVTFCTLSEAKEYINPKYTKQ